MPSATKDLLNVNDTLELDVSSAVALTGHGSTGGTCQYVSGAGTVQVEATNQDTRLGTEVWFIPIDFANAPVATQTAVGAIEFPIAGFNRVRVRKTVGAASCIVSLGVN